MEQQGEGGARIGVGGDVVRQRGPEAGGEHLLAAADVAEDADNPRPVGGVLVTLLPDEDPTSWNAFHWKEPPPPDCLERGIGRPHLTWIFVSPLEAGRGVATALLNAAIRELLALGYRQLGAHLDGVCPLEQAVTETISATAAYARRQRTWFRKEASVARLVSP